MINEEVAEEEIEVVREMPKSTLRETLAAILITLFFTGIIASFLGVSFPDLLIGFLKTFER